MVQAPITKELTVKQYEFYKRKGLSDERVMKMHGYHSAGLNAWKKENDLIGVKFEKDVKVTQGSIVTSPSVDSKPQIFTEMAVEQFESKMDSENQRTEAPDSAPASTDEQIPYRPIKDSKTAHNEDSEQPSTDWLNERHGQDTETIHLLRQDLKESEKERYAETIRGDDWRNKFIAADRDSKKKDVDIANLKFEIEKMNALLEQAYQNDKLMDGVMRLYLETKGKLNESVEGEVMDKWR